MFTVIIHKLIILINDLQQLEPYISDFNSYSCRSFKISLAYLASDVSLYIQSLNNRKSDDSPAKIKLQMTCHCHYKNVLKLEIQSVMYLQDCFWILLTASISSSQSIELGCASLLFSLDNLQIDIISDTLLSLSLGNWWHNIRYSQLFLLPRLKTCTVTMLGRKLLTQQSPASWKCNICNYM